MKRKLFLSIPLLVFLYACQWSLSTPGTAKAVLVEVLKGAESCQITTGVEAAENTASFSCRNSADTYYTVSMTRYPDEAQAQAQFEASRGEIPVECFHGYARYQVSAADSVNRFIVNQQTGWQAGPWLIAINASFDYGYFHYTTESFAEAVYASAVKHHLFPAGVCP